MSSFSSYSKTIPKNEEYAEAYFSLLLLMGSFTTIIPFLSAFKTVSPPVF
jgi:hypothetical protein